MTREEKLISMKMTDLVEVAQKLNIKIDVKGSKSKAVAKILAAENAVAESEKPAEVETVAETAVVDNEQNLTDEQYAEIGKEIAEEAKQKAKRAQQRAKKEKKASAPKVDVLAITESVVKSLDLKYKRSRDGIGIFNSEDKRVLDIWKRSSKIRVYIASDNAKYSTIVKSNLIEKLHDNPSKNAKLDKSFYVEASNIEKLLAVFAK